MPTYANKALKQFQHTLKKKQHQSFPSAKIIYRAEKQYATQQSSAPLLDKKKKEIQTERFWLVLIFGKGSRHHSTDPHQYNYFTTSNTDRRHNETINTAIELHSNIRRNSADILCQRHEISSAQKHKLPQ